MTRGTMRPTCRLHMGQDRHIATGAPPSSHCAAMWVNTCGVRGLLCPSLIGRDDELEDLTRALDDAADSRGSVVFVAGEAGIGKTRLVQETIAVARQRRVRVLLGRATIPHSTVAFRPLTEALFSYFRNE